MNVYYVEPSLFGLNFYKATYFKCLSMSLIDKGRHPHYIFIGLFVQYSNLLQSQIDDGFRNALLLGVNQSTDLPLSASHYFAI